MIHIYNSQAGQKQALRPLVPGRVGLYVCGITVYDYCHIGHARAMVVFDMVVRYLRARGFDVTYVRNITDIDDKIIRRAAEKGVTPAELAATYTRAMHDDAAELGLVPPNQEPRATDHIGAIIAMIQTLCDKGHAYAPPNGDVYYDVSGFARYGRLSGKRLADLRAGERVAVDAAKDDALDFVLWKAAKPGEPAWDSPWGRGRPGWHIECSAMSTRCLGETFDIHGGGADLIFPHHENEIAQSEAATGKPFVNLWMHNGFVTIDDEKMAKSLGNFLTIQDVLDRWDPETVRYFILASHYRSPLAYTEDRMASADAALTRLYLALRGHPRAEAERKSIFEKRFHEAMEDDFNTPEAMSVLFDCVKEINRIRAESPRKAAQLAKLLALLGNKIGLLDRDADEALKFSQLPRAEEVELRRRRPRILHAGQGRLTVRGERLTAQIGPDDTQVQIQIDERSTARKRNDFTTADRIRDHLLANGIVLEDSPEGTTWRRARRGARR